MGGPRSGAAALSEPKRREAVNTNPAQQRGRRLRNPNARPERREPKNLRRLRNRPRPRRPSKPRSPILQRPFAILGLALRSELEHLLIALLRVQQLFRLLGCHGVRL